MLDLDLLSGFNLLLALKLRLSLDFGLCLRLSDLLRRKTGQLIVLTVLQGRLVDELVLHRVSIGIHALSAKRIELSQLQLVKVNC